MTQEDRDLALKIARHYSELYQKRTEAIIKLTEVLVNMRIHVSRDYNNDKQWML